MSIRIHMSSREPTTSISGGVQSEISWDKVADVIRGEVQVMHDEEITEIEVTDRGLRVKMEKRCLKKGR